LTAVLLLEQLLKFGKAVRYSSGMPNKRALGLILKTARKSRGIRQGDISPELGITPAALSHIEAGRNTASPEVLEAYARHLVKSDDVHRLVRALLSVDSDSLTEISALLNPSDPEGFEKYITQAIASHGESSRMSQWNFSPLDSVPRRAMWSMTKESSNSKSFHERDSVTRALRSFIIERGGKVLIAGRESSDFGLGFSMKCDLVETTKSLVIWASNSSCVSPHRPRLGSTRSPSNRRVSTVLWLSGRKF
jgi:transcriptional regulator with XRE-family HTH domain